MDKSWLNQKQSDHGHPKRHHKPVLGKTATRSTIDPTQKCIHCSRKHPQKTGNVYILKHKCMHTVHTKRATIIQPLKYTDRKLRKAKK